MNVLSELNSCFGTLSLTRGRKNYMYIESCIMVLDAVAAAVNAQSEGKQKPLFDTQLEECLQYRRSVFRSSHLRLVSL